MYSFARRTDILARRFPRYPNPYVRALTLAIVSLAPTAALAQAEPWQGSAPQAAGGPGQQQSALTLPGRLAESEVGEVGRRQTRDQEIANIKPAARINNRIANRVQSRIRNRIDRSYDPQANATSPFRLADAESRDTRQDPRR